MDTQNQKISKEVALQEFDRIIENYDLLFDLNDMDAEDAAGFKKYRSRIVRAIMRGVVELNEEGWVSFKNKVTAEPLVFKDAGGADFMAMDKRKTDAVNARVFSLGASMTGTSIITFQKLRGEELKIAQALLTLFLD